METGRAWRPFFHRALHHAADVRIALVGDDALGVVVQLGLAVLDVLLQVSGQRGVQLQFLQDPAVPLEELDGIPAQVTLLHPALDGFLNVGDGVLHAAGEHMGQLAGLPAPGQGDGPFSRSHASLALQCAHLHDLAAQRLAQLLPVDLVPVLADQVDHVDRHHHGDAQLDELGGQVQVALHVGAVHDVQDGVGLLAHQVAAGHDLLQGIGGEGIDAGQVLDDHVLMALQLALLLFHRDAGPVAHVLVGAGQGIEQGGLTAVRVARQRNFDVHLCSPFQTFDPAKRSCQTR